MCIEVRIEADLPADGGLDLVQRRLLLNAALGPLQRTVVARALLIQAGVPQREPSARLRCLCGDDLVVEAAWPLAG